MKQELENRIQQAVDNFMQGYGCSQSVVAAFADIYGLDDDREGKSACYKVVQELLETFRQRNGSIICSELLGLGGVKPQPIIHMPDERNAEYYKVRPCARKVESAARVFAEYLEKK